MTSICLAWSRRFGEIATIHVQYKVFKIIMFLPNNKADEEKKVKRSILDRIELWSLDLIEEEIRDAVQLAIQEVICGDPNCAPIDTIVTIVFNSGGRGMVGLPMESKDVTVADLKEFFPTTEVLRKWHKGEEAEWPPNPEFEDAEMPTLRFNAGQRVQCRVGPTEWHSGIILQTWYRETSWPAGAWAPYKVKLDDGRKIFAPGDMEQIIKLEPLGEHFIKRESAATDA
mmetsp:Transcript_20358/g.22777  ORF Transcript_20358/g.22777 Transcript_20358/m.22777 type:complete len:228 (-) Transcript_20358:186-869(-)